MALINDEPNRLAVDALNPRPGETVLELGFGPGWALRTIAARTRGARLYGVDQSARMLEQATRVNEVAVSRGRMVLVQGPFSPLPWIDETFDKVLLVNVVYFFDSGGRDILEAYRVLRSGGRLVIYVTSRHTMHKWRLQGPIPTGHSTRTILLIFLRMPDFADPTSPLRMQSLRLASKVSSQSPKRQTALVTQTSVATLLPSSGRARCWARAAAGPAIRTRS
jgi:SAM-dependent methyltransferase